MESQIQDKNWISGGMGWKYNKTTKTLGRGHGIDQTSRAEQIGGWRLKES